MNRDTLKNVSESDPLSCRFVDIQVICFEEASRGKKHYGFFIGKGLDIPPEMLNDIVELFEKEGFETTIEDGSILRIFWY